MTERELDELRRLGEELRQAFADERRAISELDHQRLEQLATVKRTLAVRLSAFQPTANPELRTLFDAIRTEARATAILAAAATQAVRAMLGYEPAAGYDRKARQLPTGPTRILTAL